MKKWILILAIGVIIIPITLFLLKKPADFSQIKECAFCNSKVIKAQKFYEDETVVALYTHKPIVPCHFLLLPKRHVERFEQLTEEEVVKIAQAVKKIDQIAQARFQTTSYFLHQKNGTEVGQSVPHVHFHYVGKQEGDYSPLKFVFNMIYADWAGPLSKEKMHEVVAKLEKTLKEST